MTATAPVEQTMGALYVTRPKPSRVTRSRYFGVTLTSSVPVRQYTLVSSTAIAATPLRRPVEINDSEVAFLPVVLASRNPTTER
jgi:hypothetical protein